MQHAEPIALYEDILHVTGDMLSAARNAEWDRLIELEIECRSLVDQIQPREKAAPLNDRLQRRKVEIIHGILANDAEIRERVNPWMTKLRKYLGAASNERLLRTAYREGG